jgi:hypothetical protein
MNNRQVPLAHGSANGRPHTNATDEDEGSFNEPLSQTLKHKSDYRF